MFTVSYLPHEKFTVDENGIDLIYIERIKLVDALLGFSYVQTAPPICWSGATLPPLLCPTLAPGVCACMRLTAGKTSPALTDSWCLWSTPRCPFPVGCGNAHVSMKGAPSCAGWRLFPL